HRESIRGGVGQGYHAVEKSRSRDGETDTRFLRQVAADRCRIAGGLLMMEADVASAFGLSQPRQVGHRNAGHTVDGVEAIELHGIDHQVKLVRYRSRSSLVFHGRSLSTTLSRYRAFLELGPSIRRPFERAIWRSLLC